MQWRQMNEYMVAHDLYILYPSLPDRTEFAKVNNKQFTVNEGGAAAAKAATAANAVAYDSNDGLVNSY